MFNFGFWIEKRCSRKAPTRVGVKPLTLLRSVSVNLAELRRALGTRRGVGEFFPAVAGHAHTWIEEEILTPRTQWEVGGRGHYGFMHNVEMCWKLDFDL